MEDKNKRRERAEQIVNGRWEEFGFDALLPAERQYIAIWWLTREVSNGTFHQYFSNSAGDLAPLAIEGLIAVDASATLQTLTRGMELFHPSVYPVDRDMRNMQLQAIPTASNGGRDVFDELSDELMNNGEDYEGQTLDRLDEIYSKCEVC